MNSNPDNKDPAPGRESDRRAGETDEKVPIGADPMRPPVTKEWIERVRREEALYLGKRVAEERAMRRLRALKKQDRELRDRSGDSACSRARRDIAQPD